MAEVIAALGGVDILVNNAHTSNPMVPFEQVSDKDMAIAMHGFHGAFYFMQACFEQLKALATQPGGSPLFVVPLGNSFARRHSSQPATQPQAKSAVEAELGDQSITPRLCCVVRQEQPS